MKRLILSGWNADKSVRQHTEVARVHFKDGPSIRDENAQLVGYVYVDLDPKLVDISTYVDKAKAVVEQKASLPSGYIISWSGQFENMERVKQRLLFVISITLLLIVFLLFFNTKSWTKTAIVLLAVPFSLVGAVHRVRPKLMTVAALFMGLIPIMWSVGAGADVMKRIAAPMIGGLITSFLLELLIYPVVYCIWKDRTHFLVSKSS